MARATALAEEQRRALDRLSEAPVLDGFYLAGGTAIAIYCGHRQSLDLDLFSARFDIDLESAIRSISDKFQTSEVVSRSDAAVQLLCDGARIDVVRYPYPALEPLKTEKASFPLAGLRDLGAMKLAAIARRGIRRDFWDLYAILNSGGPHNLKSLSADYLRKFGVRENDLYHVLKALTYFDDAELDPALPQGMTPALWLEIKRFFLSHAPELVG